MSTLKCILTVNFWSLCGSMTLTETRILAFFISNSFISKTRLKLAQNQANAKQHP